MGMVQGGAWIVDQDDEHKYETKKEGQHGIHPRLTRKGASLLGVPRREEKGKDHERGPLDADKEEHPGGNLCVHFYCRRKSFFLSYDDR
jgi:hypothetical protein